MTHEAKFVIDAFMEALDGIRAIINDEHGTPEEVVFRVNEALRIGHEFLNKDVERLNEIIRKGEWHGEDVKMGK